MKHIKTYSVRYSDKKGHKGKGKINIKTRLVTSFKKIKTNVAVKSKKL